MEKDEYAIFNLPFPWLAAHGSVVEAAGRHHGMAKNVDFSLVENSKTPSDPDKIQVRIGASHGIMTAMKASGKLNMDGVNYDAEHLEDIEKPE